MWAARILSARSLGKLDGAITTVVGLGTKEVGAIPTKRESHGDATGKEFPTLITWRLVVMLKLTSRLGSWDSESLFTIEGVLVSVGVVL